MRLLMGAAAWKTTGTDSYGRWGNPKEVSILQQELMDTIEQLEQANKQLEQREAVKEELKQRLAAVQPKSPTKAALAILCSHHRNWDPTTLLVL